MKKFKTVLLALACFAAGLLTMYMVASERDLFLRRDRGFESGYRMGFDDGAAGRNGMYPRPGVGYSLRLEDHVIIPHPDNFTDEELQRLEDEGVGRWSYDEDRHRP